MKNANFKRKTLQNTADKYICGGNRYDSHLQQFDEMPRLSILNNYKRIKQIMNINYVKGFQIEQKYNNRTKQDSEQDPEWQKYKEEKQNSMKMGTILRSLNSTNTRKRRTLLPSESLESGRFRQNNQNVQSMSQLPPVVSGGPNVAGLPGIRKVREVAEQEDDEIY